MELTGTIIMIGETQSFGKNGFKKREFAIETSEQYPQKILLEVVQDKCSILDDFNEGDVVDASINLRGREWTSPDGDVKYFNTIQAWKINESADI